MWNYRVDVGLCWYWYISGNSWSYYGDCRFMPKEYQVRNFNSRYGLFTCRNMYFAICFIVALVSTDSDTETTKPTEITQTTTTDTEESGELIVEEENLIDCEILDCNIKYVSHEVDYDRSDKKCVFVYYTFTNNNKESKEFGYMVDDKAFQNGIELELS